MEFVDQKGFTEMFVNSLFLEYLENNLREEAARVTKDRIQEHRLFNPMSPVTVSNPQACACGNHYQPQPAPGSYPYFHKEAQDEQPPEKDPKDIVWQTSFDCLFNEIGVLEGLDAIACEVSKVDLDNAKFSADNYMCWDCSPVTKQLIENRYRHTMAWNMNRLLYSGILDNGFYPASDNVKPSVHCAMHTDTIGEVRLVNENFNSQGRFYRPISLILRNGLVADKADNGIQDFAYVCIDARKGDTPNPNVNTMLLSIWDASRKKQSFSMATAMQMLLRSNAYPLHNSSKPFISIAGGYILIRRDMLYWLLLSMDEEQMQAVRRFCAFPWQLNLPKELRLDKEGESSALAILARNQFGMI